MNSMNRILAFFSGATAALTALVIWEIFKGWRVANGLP
jgi:hypothetical protein